MNCRNLCMIKDEICREAALTNDTPTTFEVTVDAHGNIDFTDPDNHFTAAYSENVGNLSGVGTLIERFHLDPHLNLQYNNQ